ncbi:MAG: non-canonical purine NTP pyrophosphatase, partial [Polyangiaceae bacterium]|nr:non-canonical purine NTP pyrophosphatase [Polyangiaceae bacterium]
MAILFATTNPHKLRELWQILTPLGVEVRGLDSLKEPLPEP